MKPTRTRFAPSPTGQLHIGGVRTALFQVLLAHHDGGQALLRIDDTDRERLVPGVVAALLADFRWLGLHYDEGPSDAELEAAGQSAPGLGIGGPCAPYVQSLRITRYQEIAEQLIAEGFAYRCDCSSEKLAKEREEQTAQKQAVGYSGYCRNRNVPRDTPHVIRFRIPEDRSIGFLDAVKGEVHWEKIILRDPVLLKSDGFPTYHLATVVDDHDMRISHVLRADEWLSSTPLHLLIYEALQWEVPIIGHLPQVLGEDGKKLSKRHGATFLSSFREAGYLPQAILNFLALIGWSPGEGEQEEIFSLDELTRRFDLNRVNRAGGVFSYEKLNWMNGMYIRRLDPAELERVLRNFMSSPEWTVDAEKLHRIVPHIQERITLLADAAPLIDFLFKTKIERDLGAMLKKGVDAAIAREICLKSAKALADLETFEVTLIESAVRAVAEDVKISPGSVMTVVRIAVTGKKVTPPLFESIYALGQKESVERLAETAELLASL
jgi:glutamyl-tRNA synthetase